ncbi:protein of unknown function [Taphrina deformans PYCC 5710]|uniref:Uncharacterized protein n=1 Tax=Taphrina deformans (strain PYCC 5710 / ATCC 11124 / CBS 356.35 / IMI 108563 / JCM 9778 / NBRC 8474) TaxID=1097556 RepID=R4X9I3_TAPDE|nr:protein of unknown function [Taphrina deformans PYCC 5710]|eukprot:CCG82416.1 protein of unknown function [Taphrina deformans PYCC 5710]
MMGNETLEQAGSRNLQSLLVNPNDGLAMHNMIKFFTASVKERPESCVTISSSLDRAGRSLCAAAMQSQALISATSDQDKLRYGTASIKRINHIYTQGYDGKEDVGYWKHNILHPERQLDLVLQAYISLLETSPASVHDYSQTLIVDFKNIWRAQHSHRLRSIYDVLKAGGPNTQGKANLLLEEVMELKKSLP